MLQFVSAVAATLLLVMTPGMAFASLADYDRYEDIVPKVQRHANGWFEVQIKVGAVWRQVAKLAYDPFFREKSCDLSPYGAKDGELRVRLVQKGGAAAHVDAVSFGSSLPAAGMDDVTYRKLTSKDFDVLDATKKTLEFVFDREIPEQILRVVARIEGERISTEPFKFPLMNTFRELGPESIYYTYVPRNEAQGAPAKGEPFFQELCVPGTGHPVGYTYGWVWNDDDYLHVYMDVTGDNTFDGTKDYAAVHVNVGDEVKTFRISLLEQKYGETSFEYTDRADYQHKTYRFKIPQSEVAGLDAPVQMAFSVYGTMAPAYNWECKIPYNISDGDWWTGLHILPDPTYFGGGILLAPGPTTYTFQFYFFSDSDSPYQSFTRNIPVGGLTLFVQNLLDVPANFESPSFLYILSDQRFTVTQFLGQFSQPGFSHQTFFAFPNEMGWPFEEETILLK